MHYKKFNINSRYVKYTYILSTYLDMIIQGENGKYNIPWLSTVLAFVITVLSEIRF